MAGGLQRLYNIAIKAGPHDYKDSVTILQNLGNDITKTRLHWQMHK